MQRTQIYFEETMLEEMKQKAKALGISLSAYIREVLQKDLEEEKRKPQKLDLSEFAGMWGEDVTLEEIRKRAWR